MVAGKKWDWCRRGWLTTAAESGQEMSLRLQAKKKTQQPRARNKEQREECVAVGRGKEMEWSLLLETGKV